MTGVVFKYTSSPKHKNTGSARGRKGSLCPEWSHELAQELLNKSEPHPDVNKRSRYVTHQKAAFAARCDNQGHWHGYPVDLNEVPEEIRRKWKKLGLV